ncbi:MAG: 3-methyl-2-oxobutanoate dehydrogenase subunit VorB [Defluviitaleaceae bacterium]|nr:3-methyl-2-oxobutanoate dehydrogenase subunit VorB [Defluviitaleaceae bacterium]
MKVLMKGNIALSEAAIQAGCTAFFGYPITPQNEIPEYMSAKMEPAGGVFIQAESEVGAINMVYGAAAAGARTMTTSSSPGMALKQEGISYLCGANLPCVIVNVARCGPGLGGILPGQSDYFQATRGGGNGDYYTPVYAPSTVQECWDLVFHSFDIADKYRTPVMILLDGMLGQMMEPVETKVHPRLNVDKPWATNGNAASRPRNAITSLSLFGEVLEAMNLERFKVYEEIAKKEVMVENTVKDGDTVAIVAYGAPSRIVVNAIDELKEEGINAGLIRPITLWPYPGDIFLNLPSSVNHILVAELSMGQMVEDVRLAVNGKYPVHFYGRTGGVVFEPIEIANKVREILGKPTKEIESKIESKTATQDENLRGGI